MRIETIADIKTVTEKMHDSEFSDKDFSFNPKKRIFLLKSVSSELPYKEFSLKFFDVENYEPYGLEKVMAKRATAGVFDNIQIKESGRTLIIISQDLKIKLNLKELSGEFLEGLK